MTTWVFAVSAVALVGVGFRFLRRGPSLASWTEHAAHTGNMEPLIEHIETREADPATAWDQAIGSLWGSYHRDAAAQLVVAGVQRNDSTVFQFWMRKILEVEAEIAQDVFTQEFLDEHFRPEIAAKCGKGCGCG